MLAEVHYEVLADGKIKIISLAHFLNYTQIKKKFGDEVARIYFESNKYMRGKEEVLYPTNDSDGIRIIKTVDIVIKNKNRETVYGGAWLSEGQILYSKSFGKLIADVKACGKNLCTIVESVKMHYEFGVQEKVIKI